MLMSITVDTIVDRKNDQYHIKTNQAVCGESKYSWKIRISSHTIEKDIWATLLGK